MRIDREIRLLIEKIGQPLTITFTCPKCKCVKEVEKLPKSGFCGTCEIKVSRITK